MMNMKIFIQSEEEELLHNGVEIFLTCVWFGSRETVDHLQLVKSTMGEREKESVIRKNAKSPHVVM